MKKKNQRLDRNDYGAVAIFYLFVLFILTFSLGGCTKTQAVIAPPQIEPPRAELMQAPILPLPNTEEPEALKRCIQNQANVRTKCAANNDNNRALQNYVRKTVPAAKRIE